MKIKTEQQAAINRSIMIILAIGLIIVLAIQAYLLMNQTESSKLQVTIEAQQTQVAALIPTQTLTPSSTPIPTLTPTLTLTPSPTMTSTPAPTATITPTPNKPYEYLRIDLRFESILEQPSWSPNKQLVLFGTFDSVIVVYDINKDREVRRFEGMTSYIKSTAWSPDGKFVASADLDQRIYIWDVNTGETIARLRPTNTPFKIAWSPDGNYFASANYYQLMIWKTDTWELVSAVDTGVFKPTFAWSPNSKQLIYTAKNSFNFLNIDADGVSKEATEIRRTEDVIDIAFSPITPLIATTEDDDSIHLYNLSTAEEIFELIEHFGTINSVDFSPDGRFLASGGDDTTMLIWSVETGELLYTLEHEEDVEWVTWSPDGHYLAADTFDIVIWDVSSLQNK